MMVQEDIRKCVGFICLRKDGLVRAAGTAFFVGLPVPGFSDKRMFPYIVTARRVIDSVRAESDDG